MRIAAATIALALAASVSSGQPYDLSWRTVDGGGATFSTGAAWSLGATLGQPDAGGPLVGTGYTLHGGFWALVAGGGAGPLADLSVTKTDGLSSAVPGQGVTYTIEVTNAGPSAVTGARVLDAPPAILGGVSWTCAASPGSSCPASGPGGIDQAVDLLANGTATFTLIGTLDAAATGSLVNTASVTVPPGVTDPSAANNSATDTDTLVPQADLALVLTDSPDPVGQGGTLTYQAQVTNSGPSLSPGMSVIHALPAAVTFLTSTPGAPTCSHAGGVVTCQLGALAPSASTTLTVQVAVDPTAIGPLSSTATVTGDAPDPVPGNDADTEETSVLIEAPEGELNHGTRILADLAGAGGVPDFDLYRIRQAPYASYEILLDAASGDVGAGQGPDLDRLASDGVTVLQSATNAGAGSSRSLRFANATSAPITDQRVRVRSLGCGADCGAEDVYRLRAWDTSYAVARFNNSASQLTVLVLQNPTSQATNVTVLFWSASGALLAAHPASIAPRGSFVLNTATVPGLIGASGNLTVVNDAPYGALVGKAIALEPATAFTFDTSLIPRPR